MKTQTVELRSDHTVVFPEFCPDWKREEVRGASAVVVSAACWAIGHFIVKAHFGETSPWLIAFFLSSLGAGIVLLFFPVSIRSLRKRFLEYPWRFLGIAVTGVVIGNSLMFIGLSKLDLGVALLIESLRPVLTLLLAAIFIGERFAFSAVPYVLFTVLSAFVIANGSPLELSLKGNDLVGVFAVLGAAISWSLSIIMGRSILRNKVPGEEVAIIRLALGGILLFPIFLGRDSLGLSFDFDATTPGPLLAAALMTNSTVYVLLYRGLLLIAAGNAAVLQLTEPLFGVALGYLLLGERMSWLQFAAIPVLLLSVSLVVKKNSR